jgi:hypothetical protein
LGPEADRAGTRWRIAGQSWTRFEEPVRLAERWKSQGGAKMLARVCFTLLAALWIVSLAACTPKVQIEAPKEPITINLNIKIEHEIRVKVDEDLENLFDEDDDIF